MSDLVIFDSDKMNQLAKTCKHFAGSSLVPYALKNKPQDIMIIMIMAHELNLPPMQALTSISVIQGKPTISPDLMAGLVRAKLPQAIIKHEIDYKNKIAVCTTARSKEDLDNGLGYTSTWDMNRAAMMGLASKDNYKKQPVTMLKHRATGEACRAMFSDVILGIYAPEEFQDFDGHEIKPVSLREIELEADFPIPPEEKVFGFLYRFQKGKLGQSQVKDLALEDLEAERDRIEKTIGEKSQREWSQELLDSLNDICANYEIYQDAYEEAKE